MDITGTPPGRGAQPVALVTGAGRDPGFLLARELARGGHHLVVCARDEDGLRVAADDRRRHGTVVETVAADVADRDDAERLVARTEHRFPRLDRRAARRWHQHDDPASGTDVGHPERTRKDEE